MARRRSWRWWHWLGFLSPALVCCAAVLAFLTPPDALIWPSGILGKTYRGDL